MTSTSTCAWSAHSNCKLAKLSPALARTRLRPAPARQHRALTCALFGGNKGDGQGGGGGGNPFAALGNMGNMMESVRPDTRRVLNLKEQVKKAQQLVQVEAAKVQEELGAAEFDGYSNDETVRVVMSGNQEPKSVDITEEAIAGGPEKLSMLVTEAMKDAHSKSVEGMKLKMKDMASKLGLGGGANPFGALGQ